MSTSLANLRPNPNWKPGVSGNPSGRPKSAAYKRAVEKVFQAKMEVSKGRKVARLTVLLEAAYDKALIQLKSSPTGLQDVMPFLLMLRDTFDGKPKDQPEASATKESRVYLVGGQVTKTEEVQTISETVKIERPDN